MNASNEKVQLKPCPFCLGKNLELGFGTKDREGTPYYLYCQDCGATGPWEYSPNGRFSMDIAAKNWNAVR